MASFLFKVTATGTILAVTEVVSTIASSVGFCDVSGPHLVAVDVAGCGPVAKRPSRYLPKEPHSEIGPLLAEILRFEDAVKLPDKDTEFIFRNIVKKAGW